jgi:hypothetical protein
MRFFIPLCLLLLSGPSLAAQSAKLSIRTLSLYPVEMPELYTPDGRVLVPLTFTDIQPSEPLQVARLSGLPIYTTPVIPEGNAAPPHTVKLPGTASAILLLGWLGPEEKPRFLAIPDPAATARQSDWMVINSTTNNVTLQIGANTKPVPIKPRSHQAIRVRVPVNTGAAVTMTTPREDSWKTFYSTYWPVYEDKRCLILIVQDGKKMRVKQIFEDLPKPK